MILRLTSEKLTLLMISVQICCVSSALAGADIPSSVWTMLCCGTRFLSRSDSSSVPGSAERVCASSPPPPPGPGQQLGGSAGSTGPQPPRGPSLLPGRPPPQQFTCRRHRLQRRHRPWMGTSKQRTPVLPLVNRVRAQSCVRQINLYETAAVALYLHSDTHTHTYRTFRYVTCVLHASGGRLCFQTLRADVTCSCR